MKKNTEEEEDEDDEEMTKESQSEGKSEEFLVERKYKEKLIRTMSSSKNKKSGREIWIWETFISWIPPIY